MTAIDAASAWQSHLLEAPAQIRRLLERTRRIAVLGIKPEFTGQPAYYVPEFTAQAGYEIIPVPVYYPEVTEILGQKVYRKLVDVPGDIDLVNVFRRPKDIPQHVDDLIAKRPRAVWFQLGIRNDEAAQELARAGILVVQDRCTAIDHARLKDGG